MYIPATIKVLDLFISIPSTSYKIYSISVIFFKLGLPLTSSLIHYIKSPLLKRSCRHYSYMWRWIRHFCLRYSLAYLQTKGVNLFQIQHSLFILAASNFSNLLTYYLPAIRQRGPSQCLAWRPRHFCQKKCVLIKCFDGIRGFSWLCHRHQGVHDWRSVAQEIL